MFIAKPLLILSSYVIFSFVCLFSCSFSLFRDEGRTVVCNYLSNVITFCLNNCLQILKYIIADCL